MKLLQKIALALLAISIGACYLEPSTGRASNIQKNDFQQDTKKHKAPNSNRIENIKQDLKELSNAVRDNAELDELMQTANQIGAMNDRCGIISLNEVLDESCQTFYKVTLPEFEKKYSQVTGSIRIGSMRLQEGVQNRIANINACVDALKAFYNITPSSIMELAGDIKDIIPVDDMGEKVNVKYDFQLQYSDVGLRNTFGLALDWNNQCRDAITDKTTGDFIPMFVKKVEALNEQMHRKSPVRIWTESERTITMNRMYIAFVEGGIGYYRLGGEKLFTIKSDVRFLEIYSSDGRELVRTGHGNCGQFYERDHLEHYFNGKKSCRVGYSFRFEGGKQVSTINGINGTWIWY